MHINNCINCINLLFLSGIHSYYVSQNGELKFEHIYFVLELATKLIPFEISTLPPKFCFVYAKVTMNTDESVMKDTKVFLNVFRGLETQVILTTVSKLFVTEV